MNEPRLHPNENDHVDRTTKRNVKKIKVTTYTNKINIPFRWLNQTCFA